MYWRTTAADVEEVACTYLYRQGETWFFMNSESYEQYELNADQVARGDVQSRFI